MVAARTEGVITVMLGQAGSVLVKLGQAGSVWVRLSCTERVNMVMSYTVEMQTWISCGNSIHTM